MTQDPNWTVLAFDEAAQNAAALTNIAAIDDPTGLVRKSGDQFIALQDLWIFFAMCFGDSLDITRWNLDGSFMGGRTLDARSAGIETGHDVQSGIMDLRMTPVFWPKGTTLEAKFVEDKSTNVEASVLVWVSEDPYNLNWNMQPTIYMELLQLTITQASTTAATFKTGKTLSDDNHDSRLLEPEGEYEVIGLVDGLGGTSCKLARLMFPGKTGHRPGVKCPEDNIDTPMPPWAAEWPTPRPTFLGDASPQVETFDRDGSLTPITVWKVGRIR